jgi:CRP-like cAMP-binding protein
MGIPKSPLANMVRTLESQAHLQPEDCAALLALSFTSKMLRPDAYVVREGHRPTHCSILLSGFAYRQKTHTDGGRQILSLHLPGDMLDLQNLFLDVSDHNVQTMTRSEVAFIPRSELVEIFYARPAIGKAILLSLLVEASILREWLLNVGRRDARARLAHLLCEFASRQAGGGEIGDEEYEMPMTQEQLADALGLTPVHINRTLRTLEEDGLFIRDKRSFRFPEWERLQQVAGFSRSYLHQRQQA